MSAVLAVAAAMLTVAALVLLVRLTIGPTILDRSVALDVLMSVTICATALYSAHFDRTEVLPVLLVLAMVGFVGAVSIARYANGSDDVEAEGEADESPEEDR
ncbi:monovalent cation/H+ antiporter complex subunit F [Nocardioides pantholopis]|uniref:monovalent cation/H+ antiporter complex subunit F n=1 Tax=Nocardioides pantholopis TaxID=2483798 RepID=UPI000F0954BA|nr:monovalent cation/H+ antiporter complex subunit F [Nocardioides pantholopis]